MRGRRGLAPSATGGSGRTTFPLVEWLTWSTTEMAVTNQRLIVKRGWISRRTFEMQIGKIEHIEI